MSQPNIIFITCDHLRTDFLGCAGHPVIQTPHIDFLAERGTRFTQAYCPTPVCIPARQTIMSGYDSHHLGLTYYKEGFEIPTKETLPRLLARVGYQTKAIGKMHLYPERDHHGFETMILCEEGRRLGVAKGEYRGYGDYEEWLAKQGYPGEAWTHGVANNETVMRPWHLPDHLHPTEWIGREACKEIKRRDWTRPLFMWVSFTAPHPPLAPLLRDLMIYDRDEMPHPVMGDWLEHLPLDHQKIIAKYRSDRKNIREIDQAYRGYFALMTQVDRWVNLIIGTLREEGLLQNTWLVFASDHGDSMGDHGLWAKRNFMKGACNIPLIVTPPPQGDLNRVMGPEWIPGRTCNTVVGLQDIMPTILEIAGVPAPREIDGKSLLPLAHDPNLRVREIFLGEHGEAGQRSFMLTDGHWKYLWYEADGNELLFEIAIDPDECHDRSCEDQRTLFVWRERLTAILADRGNDPAVVAGKLQPKQPGRRLTELEKARMVTDHNVRGLH